MTLQTKRLWLRSAFFALFVLTPPLDLFRLDLTLGHFILFGQNWTLGIDAFVAGEAGAGHAFLNLLLRAFVPIVLVAGGVIWVAWRWGRLYCGWLCPHFSVVETINALMRRAGGRPSLWERHPLPERLPDGRRITPRRIYWLWTYLAVVGFAFLWAVAFLTYLLPPAEVYRNLIHLELTRNQALFIGVGTFLLSIEFLFARHLFCRFACAVGLFQSLAWMGNKKAMVVGFERRRVAECTDCDNACDHACPMRLKPRSMKRRMFTCTQCARCLEACEQVKGGPTESLLHWVGGDAALDVSDRDLGKRPRFSSSAERTSDSVGGVLVGTVGGRDAAVDRFAGSESGRTECAQGGRATDGPQLRTGRYSQRVPESTPPTLSRPQSETTPTRSQR